jgi:hypothetical protein
MRVASLRSLALAFSFSSTSSHPSTALLMLLLVGRWGVGGLLLTTTLLFKARVVVTLPLNVGKLVSMLLLLVAFMSATIGLIFELGNEDVLDIGNLKIIDLDILAENGDKVFPLVRNSCHRYEGLDDIGAHVTS